MRHRAKNYVDQRLTTTKIHFPLKNCIPSMFLPTTRTINRYPDIVVNKILVILRTLHLRAPRRQAEARASRREDPGRLVCLLPNAPPRPRRPPQPPRGWAARDPQRPTLRVPGASSSRPLRRWRHRRQCRYRYQHRPRHKKTFFSFETSTAACLLLFGRFWEIAVVCRSR